MDSQESFSLGTIIDGTRLEDFSIHDTVEEVVSDETDEVRFKRLYLAAIRDTAPPRLWEPLFNSLISHSDSAKTLLACAQYQNALAVALLTWYALGRMILATLSCR